MVLLGIPTNKFPESFEMLLILNFLRMHMGNLFVDEIKIAFDLAVAGKLQSQNPSEKGKPLNLELYGNKLSMKYIAGVLHAYVEYKKPIIKKLADQTTHMNNYDRAKGVLEIIAQKPEALELLKEIGATEKKKVEIPPLPFHDIHQKWMRQFDMLRRRWGRPTNDGSFIQRYGYIMNVEGYFNKKAEQLQVAREREKSRHLSL